MYIVAWKQPRNLSTHQKFEIIDGEDAMQVFVHDLVEEVGVNEDDIVVGTVIENN